MDKIRVLIVDDSPLVRVALRTILESDPQFDVVGEARDGREGVEKTLRLKPNVVTMDLRMPVMGGLEAIQEIMEKAPTAVIVISSLDVEVIVQALGVGAMDFVPLTREVEAIAAEVIEKVRIASRVRPIRHLRVRPHAREIVKKGSSSGACKIIVVGVSTGGPQALQVVLSQLPADFPAAILIVQHMAEGFVNGLAEWLKDTSALQIRVAKAGDMVQPGTVLFAPDGVHMGLEENGMIFLKEDIHRKSLYLPSIDFLMDSAAKACPGSQLVAVLMTGMGQDGVEGIKAIRNRGGTTIAQDEKSSVIFGMNKLAIDQGSIDQVVALENIPDALIRLVC